jgi:hypothetical protein
VQGSHSFPRGSHFAFPNLSDTRSFVSVVVMGRNTDFFFVDNIVVIDGNIVVVIGIINIVVTYLLSFYRSRFEKINSHHKSLSFLPQYTHHKTSLSSSSLLKKLDTQNDDDDDDDDGNKNNFNNEEFLMLKLKNHSRSKSLLSRKDKEREVRLKNNDDNFNEDIIENNNDIKNLESNNSNAIIPTPIPSSKFISLLNLTEDEKKVIDKNSFKKIGDVKRLEKKKNNNDNSNPVIESGNFESKKRNMDSRFILFILFACL